VTRVLDEVPPHLVPDQLVAEARRAAGVSVALYVVDIDGSQLLRLAGSAEFPAQLDAPPAIGPEIVPEGLPEFYARLQQRLPGCCAEPLWLRGRVLGLLLCVGTPLASLEDIAPRGPFEVASHCGGHAHPDDLVAVMIVRCTAKLRALLGRQAQLPGGPVSSPSDFYANLLHIERRRCLLVTHAATLFSVFCPDVRAAQLRPLGLFLVPRIIASSRPRACLSERSASLTPIASRSPRPLGVAACWVA